MEVSSAKIVVIFGDRAREGVNAVLEDEGMVSTTKALLGPKKLFGKERVFLFMPHPNRWGWPKSVKKNLTPEELQKLNDWVVSQN